MNPSKLSLSGLSSYGNGKEILSESPVVASGRRFHRSISENDPGAPSGNSLLARRGIKKGLTIDMTQMNRSSVGRIVDELKSKSFGVDLRLLNSPIISVNNALTLYVVPGNEGQQLYIHSLFFNKESKVEELTIDSWSADFWEQVNQNNVEKIIALADPVGKPIYMPPENNKEAYQSNSVVVGDVREFTNGLRVEVKNITVLNELAEAAKAAQKGVSESQNDVIAREITLELIAKDNKRRTVTVDQIFNCWSDTVPLPAEIAMKIVDRFVSKNMQIHCEGGMNRSPAAVAMWLISGKIDQLEVSNFLDEIAEVIAIVRACRHDIGAINEYALQSIVQFALHIKGFNADNILVSNEPRTAPAQASINRFSVCQKLTNE